MGSRLQAVTSPQPDSYSRAGMNRRFAIQTTPSTPKLIAAHSEGSGTVDNSFTCISKANAGMASLHS